MMTLLSGLLGVLGGPLFRFITVPALIALALTGFHVLVESWKEGYRRDGERRCDARWEQQIREEERNKAAEAAAASRNMLDAERRNNEELYSELERISGEERRLRSLVESGTSRNCLSDGVLEGLDSLGRKGGSKSQPQRPDPGKTGPARPTS